MIVLIVLAHRDACTGVVLDALAGLFSRVLPAKLAGSFLVARWVTWAWCGAGAALVRHDRPAPPAQSVPSERGHGAPRRPVE